MSEVKLVNPPGTEAIYEQYKFSQATVAGGFVEVSGQVGLAADFSIPDDIREQARNAYTNLRNILEAAGSDLEHVMHLTQFFTNILEAQAVDEVFTEFFPKNYPARTVIGISSLVLPQLRLEFQARAILK